MAITRTPIIDDDSSGTTGTVLDNAWKQELYNQIDAAAGKLGAPFTLNGYLFLTIAAGTYNDYSPPNGAQNTVWLLNPAGAVNLTGIAAEPDLTRHLLINVTGNPIGLQHQNGGSVGANRIIGPGYTNYTLGTWASCWIVYLAAFPNWVVEKA